MEARGVLYAILGAVAMNLHGLVADTTVDLDVAPEVANIDRLRQALNDVDTQDKANDGTCRHAYFHPHVRQRCPLPSTRIA